MKGAILLVLVLSLLVVGGCGQTATSGNEEASQPAEATQDDALELVETSLIPEDDEVEIGEMI